MGLLKVWNALFGYGQEETKKAKPDFVFMRENRETVYIDQPTVGEGDTTQEDLVAVRVKAKKEVKDGTRKASAAKKNNKRTAKPSNGNRKKR